MTWEQFKKAKQKEFGSAPDVVVIDPPRARYDEPKRERVKKFNIHKRSLPPGRPPLDKIVVFSVTKAEAEWWIEHILKAKCYQDDARDLKTIIYFDMVPVDAQPRERSIYFNPRPVILEVEGDEVPFVD